MTDALLVTTDACEVRRLTQIKFDNATSVASSSEPVESIFDRSSTVVFCAESNFYIMFNSL